MTFIELYDETKAAFAACQKSGRRQYYPKSLKDNAVKLLDYYPIQVLASVLSVTIETLRDWQSKLASVPEVESQFVEVSVADEPVKQALSSQFVSLRIQLPNKIELILAEQATSSACQFVSALVKELDACSI